MRANTSFCSSRNTPFQGPAADGAILALWKLWRAGYRLVSAIHDQVVIECPADDQVLRRKAEIERLMIEGMLAVVPGMNVRVETVISRSLDKNELDDRYCETTADKSRENLYEVTQFVALVCRHLVLPWRCRLIIP